MVMAALLWGKQWEGEKSECISSFSKFNFNGHG